MFFAEWLNQMTVHNREKLWEIVEQRPKGIPLLTISNHYSCMDDPLMWGKYHKLICVLLLGKLKVQYFL